MTDYLPPNISANTAAFSLEEMKLKALNHLPQSRENKAELKKTAQQFEAVFINQLLTQMDQTVNREDDVVDQGPGEETFRSMFYDKIAENIANRPGGSGFGLADLVYKQLEKRLPKTPEGGQ